MKTTSAPLHELAALLATAYLRIREQRAAPRSTARHGGNEKPGARSSVSTARRGQGAK